MHRLKKYLIEIIVFSVLASVLLVCLSPGITWLNTDSDGAHYILAAKYMLPAHNTSAPLFLLLGRLFLFLPFGSDAWRMGLISVISTVGASILIYLIVRRLLYDKPKSRWYGLIASVVYGSSALTISQSTIIETYALSTCLMLLAYYLSLKQKWVWASVIVGLIWAIHTLFAWIVWAILLVKYRELRASPLVILTLAFLVFYLYIPITTAINGDLGMWGNTTPSGFLRNNAGVLFMLFGGLSVWDLPKRLMDIIAILGASLGLGLVVLAYHFIKGKTVRNHLLWLFLIPVIWFAINLSPETFVYLLPSIAFGAVVVGVTLSKLNKMWALATCVVAVGLLGFNANYFDIDRTLDPEMSAEKFYHEELAKIPDGEIFMGGGWTWAMVFLYNREEGRNIIPVSTDVFPASEYLDKLESQGIKLRRSDAESQITLQGEVALSIAELNEGVWIAKEVKPEVYQYAIELAKGNEAYIGRWIGQEISPKWKWKPSNPYEFMSGQLEVVEWHHILWVRNPTGLGQMLFIIVFGVYGYGAYFLLMRALRKRRALT